MKGLITVCGAVITLKKIFKKIHFQWVFYGTKKTPFQNLSMKKEINEKLRLND